MYKCDYGCGQEAKYQFKNGKWCCSENTSSCPEVRRKNSLTSLNPSKETRQKISNAQKGVRKGKIYEDIFGEEKAKHMRVLRRKNRMGCLNPMFGKPQTDDAKQKNKEAHMGEKNHFYGKHHTDKSKRKSRESHLGKNLGENNPNWKGGISFGDYCYNWTCELKLFIKDRDINLCQNPQCKGKCNLLGVHHINYNKKDCDPRNLITLCNSCNSISNFERDWWEGFYTEINRRKYLKIKEGETPK